MLSACSFLPNVKYQLQSRFHCDRTRSIFTLTVPLSSAVARMAATGLLLRAIPKVLHTVLHCAGVSPAAPALHERAVRPS